MSAGPCRLLTISTSGCFGTLSRRSHAARRALTLDLGLMDASIVTHRMPTAGQAVYPVMPDCTSLQPTPCEILPNVTADGTIDYKTGYFVRHDHCNNGTATRPNVPGPT